MHAFPIILLAVFGGYFMNSPHFWLGVLLLNLSFAYAFLLDRFN